MGRTIIQPIGPLYGEAVNGTVFGRPNGSVFIPAENTISISTKATHIRNYAAWSNSVCICDSSGTLVSMGIVAQSQDAASYIQIDIATDSDFDTIVGGYVFTAGAFNQNVRLVDSTTKPTIVSGDTYYIRAVLMASSGVPVASSDTVELTGYVAS